MPHTRLPVRAARIGGPLRVAFFASGGPGNISAAFALESRRPDLVRVEAVICDRIGTPAAALAREKRRIVVERDFDAECGRSSVSCSDETAVAAYHSRSVAFHDQILLSLEQIERDSQFRFDIAVLAYRRLIRGALLERFADAAINQHPADLSVLDGTGRRKYVGISGLARALREGVKQTRASTILINEDVDAGEIVCQGPALRVTSCPIDDAFIAEHEQRQKAHSDWPSLTFALSALAEGRIGISADRHRDGTRVILLDNVALPYCGARIASFDPSAAEPFALEQSACDQLPTWRRAASPGSIIAGSGVCHETEILARYLPTTTSTLNCPAADDDLPIDFHCHGIGSYDFSALCSGAGEMDLAGIDALAASEQTGLVLTIFLTHGDIGCLEALIEHWGTGRRQGRYRHILGFALEGPVLRSGGGTPEKGRWIPTRAEWERITSLGPMGLIYCVVSVGGASMLGEVTHDWILEALIDKGVTPALGHFGYDDVEETVRGIDRAVGLGQRYGRRLLTDHLLNDMPRTFRHAWRTPRERECRPDELALLELSNWTLEDLDVRAGLVPATLMRHAHEGRITACLNFDGEHVDIMVARRIVELVGANNIIAMTDRVDGPCLAGIPLFGRPASSLRYNEGGAVAAGTQSIRKLIQNMRDAGLHETSISAMTRGTIKSFLPGLYSRPAA